MRAVALGNKQVQDKIAKSFVPLKIVIPYRSKVLPLDWPAMKQWRDIHKKMGGEKCEGLTGCSVIEPDLQYQLGNTGSAFVWELFDSIAYDPVKFSAMLDRSLKRFERHQAIVNDKSLSATERKKKLIGHRIDVKKAIAKEGRFRLPPKGFTIDGAKQLFRLSGDLKDGK